ncbi:hypothetical protein SLU01_33820 [Sporosarcina luteola]|uniref:Uncharacterized protein n=1 Tax=Sporosarcina luteola TaxID=582850 RepID=A0A511ZCA0_9BACL|nr:hypothetical protein SLU01_33820 [Sporosarcina luteola]
MNSDNTLQVHIDEIEMLVYGDFQNVFVLISKLYELKGMFLAQVPILEEVWIRQFSGHCRQKAAVQETFTLLYTIGID